MIADHFLLNLDAMEPSELRHYVQSIHESETYLRCDCFDADCMTLWSLAHYAGCKASAMEFRRQGNIRAATQLEIYCEEEYSRLPDYARW